MSSDTRKAVPSGVTQYTPSPRASERPVPAAIPVPGRQLQAGDREEREFRELLILKEKNTPARSAIS